jgi:hypothetical protein
MSTNTKRIEFLQSEYAIGCVDLMIEECDYAKNGLFARVFYPVDLADKQKVCVCCCKNIQILVLCRLTRVSITRIRTRIGFVLISMA